ncbi:GGDEF domain-containing protein [Clostridium manihotivorum]|uniref:GGDEF domain-containing protein n=1 Tax=Clostridium manihotivorum TaxID=2320868 RepID=A0A410E1D4_9CLOT|nr:GGDEF domain-containing protein [Clostridium manihotivorum]QAA35149.1 GGDEF domain-containing protein [Clostridium manihotivorum]
MDRILNKFTPFIISLNVIILHILGYVLDLYAPRKYIFIIWTSIAFIDAVFAFRCGMMMKDLRILAYTDKLTELYNRRFFVGKMVDEMKKLKDNDLGISLLMIDVDNFKIINDTYGHSSGDLVLKELANIIKPNIRARDTITRFGGEEFAIILPETNKEKAIIVAEKIRNLVASHVFRFKEDERNVTISIGVVSVRDQVDTQLLIDLADRALYKAKERRNTVVFSELGDLVV